MGIVMLWFYLHLPMTMGIAATGGAIALALFCVVLLMQSISTSAKLSPLYRRGGLVTLGSSLLILLLGFVSLPTIPLLATVVLLMLTPVFYGIKVWIQVFDPEAIATE